MSISEEVRYRILKALDDNPHLSQRDLARELGVSLGKVNYCMRAMIDLRFVTVRKLRTSANRTVHAYLLTSRGVEEKAKVGARFLEHCLHEYREIKKEIDRLREEVNRDIAANTHTEQ